MSQPSIATVQKACNYVAKEFGKTDNGVFCQDLYDQAKVLDVSRDSDNLMTVKFQVYTQKHLKNGMKMVHGGASSTILSMFSVLSLAADAKYWAGEEPTEAELAAFISDLGKTRSMDIQILQSVPLEANIIVKCHVLSNTKSNCFISGGIYNSKGTLLVSGIHDLKKRTHEGESSGVLRGRFSARL